MSSFRTTGAWFHNNRLDPEQKCCRKWKRRENKKDIWSFYVSFGRHVNNFYIGRTLKICSHLRAFVEACVAEWLRTRIPDLEVQGSSLARRVVSSDKELYHTLSLFTQEYKWVPATYCWGVTLRWTSIPSRVE